MTSDKTVFLFEGGVANFPSSWHDWPNQAITWIHTRTPFRAQSLFYTVTPLTPLIRRRERALTFSKIIRAYSCKDEVIHCVGHSEGTNTVLSGLRMAGWPLVRNLHLICGACDANFDRNGLNEALENNRIGQVFVYVAEKDWAMLLEETILGHWMFGMKMRDPPMGLTGAVNVRYKFIVQKRVVEIRWPRWGHSTCFEKDNFDKLMDGFVEPELL